MKISSLIPIELYASYVAPGNQPTHPGDTVWKDEYKNGLPPNGEAHGKRVILCSRIPFKMFDDDFEETPSVHVKFKKSINQVFIDDEFDLEEFGIEDDSAYEYIKNNPNTTLQDLIRFGLDITNKELSFYGCYVNEVKSNEIINIT
jgi:hypothetical protein